MLSLPRSPVLKLLILLLAALLVLAFRLRSEPLSGQSYWDFRQQQEQQRQRQQLPAEGSKERVPLSTFKVCLEAPCFREY